MDNILSLCHIKIDQKKSRSIKDAIIYKNEILELSDLDLLYLSNANTNGFHSLFKILLY